MLFSLESFICVSSKNLIIEIYKIEFDMGAELSILICRTYIYGGCLRSAKEHISIEYK
jgi:hypothetical protein